MYRNFVEYCANQRHLPFLKFYMPIELHFVGCFSMIKFKDIDDSNKAITLIKDLFSHICVKHIG